MPQSSTLAARRFWSLREIPILTDANEPGGRVSVFESNTPTVFTAAELAIARGVREEARLHITPLCALALGQRRRRRRHPTTRSLPARPPQLTRGLREGCARAACARGAG